MRMYVHLHVQSPLLYIGLCPSFCRHGNRQDSAAPLDGAASTATQSNQPPPLSFSCVECGKAFAQKNHLASHVYHKHPHAHVRKSSSSSSSREGGASGSVGGASGRVGGASGKVGRGTVQVGGTVVKLGVSPIREGGAPSPGLKSPRELLGFMQSVTSGNQLADLDVGGRSLVENSFIRGSPSTLKNDQQHLSTTREVLTLQGGSRESPSARENPAMSEGPTGRGESGDRAEVKGSGSSKRSELGTAKHCTTPHCTAVIESLLCLCVLITFSVCISFLCQ